MDRDRRAAMHARSFETRLRSIATFTDRNGSAVLVQRVFDAPRAKPIKNKRVKTPR
jgi:hypothetical protein